MRHIGHLVISVPVPEEAWGDQLTITLAPQEYEPYTNIKKVYLLPSVESRWYPLINNEFDGIIFLPLMVISFMAIIVFGVSFLMGYRQSLQGLFLAVFMFGVSCWYLGYQGLLHLVSSNIPICANAEYQALYMFMIPLIAFIISQSNVMETMATSGIKE